MRAACFAPSFLQKRGVLEGGELQVGSSHFNELYVVRPSIYSLLLTWKVEIPCANDCE